MNEDQRISDQQMQIRTYDDSDWGVVEERQPNWGSLRRLPVSRKKKKFVSKDY